MGRQDVLRRLPSGSHWGHNVDIPWVHLTRSTRSLISCNDFQASRNHRRCELSSNATLAALEYDRYDHFPQGLVHGAPSPPCKGESKKKMVGFFYCNENECALGITFTKASLTSSACSMLSGVETVSPLVMMVRLVRQFFTS